MSNTDTIDSFFNVFGLNPPPPAPALPHWRDVNWMMTNLFSANAGGPPPAPITPGVGIGGGIQNSMGPQFQGTAAVTTLFNKLIDSFPKLVFAAWPGPAPLYCSSLPDGNTITVQATLSTGTHAKQWFPPTHPAYSKPLSDIVPSQHDARNSSVPVCAVFTFDTTLGNPPNRILNLAFYLDRWQMAVDLWPHGRFPFPHP